MSWLWPRKLNENAAMQVRAGRLLHWCFIGLAILFTIVTVVGVALQGGGDLLLYITVILIWFGFAMLGRGLRYLLSRE